MPFALKGLDVAIFSVFGELGLKVSVRPMIQLDDDDFRDPYENDDYDMDPEDMEEASDKARRKHLLPRFGKFVGVGHNKWYEREDAQDTVSALL